MNESEQPNRLQTALASLVERAKQARNQFTSTRSLTSYDATDAAQLLATLAVDMASLAVNLKQAAILAAADARREISLEQK